MTQLSQMGKLKNLKKLDKLKPMHVSRELTASELNRLSATLNNGTLTEEAKQMRVTGMLNTVILSEAASQNFEQGMTRQQGQTENLRR